MDFIKGSKEEFFNFLQNIDKNENLAIITHNDIDGISSAIFLEEILLSRQLKKPVIFFTDYSK
jgi:single-stranded DNA-specific DHH superfamily exonuclease